MSASSLSKHHRGKISFLAGAAAEEAVERFYLSGANTLIARRWRGGGGEIDLIFQEQDCFVFVEVKKSDSFAHAAARVSKAQKQRIFGAALAFVAAQPHGQLSDMRFDVALVDAAGDIQILENALSND